MIRFINITKEAKMNKKDLLCISQGIGKMQGIRSISTNTLTNEFCQKMHASKNTLIICGHCYSYESLEMARFPNQVKALQRNSDILGNKELSEKEIERLNRKIKFYESLIKNKYRKRLKHLENITIPLMQTIINNYERGIK